MNKSKHNWEIIPLGEYGVSFRSLSQRYWKRCAMCGIDQEVAFWNPRLRTCEDYAVKRGRACWLPPLTWLKRLLLKWRQRGVV